jgi:putative membrane protein
MRFLVHWAIVAVSLAAAAYFVRGVHVSSLTALAIGSLVLGLVNALVRPLLQILAFPITLITLGLFYLVINALCFGLAAWLVPGFSAHGFVPALLGALVVSVASWVIGGVLGVNDEPDRKRPEKRDRR